MEVFLFSQYLAYRIGGSEESLISLAKERHIEENQIFKIVSYQDLSQHKVVPQLYEKDLNDEVEYIKSSYPISFFPYFNYWLNHSSTGDFFKKISTDTLYATSIFAPAALLAFKGEHKYIYIQSEVDLGVAWNHESGIKYILKSIYNLIEFPFRQFYKSQLNKAFDISKIVCCSEFIAGQTKHLYRKKNVRTIYPPIHYKKLQTSYNSIKNNISQSEKGIVFIGDAPYKGIKIAKKLVESLPHLKFHFFSKRVAKTVVQKNLSIHPWQKDVAHIYAYANLVIMPSFCREAFGRVAREAHALDIPVLVSNHGGLPEAVYHDPNCLVDNFKDVNSWLKKINKMNL